MFSFALLIIEGLFLVSFWWQTRLNLRQWWPDFFTSPLVSDYITPFVYLSDVLLFALLLGWLLHKVLVTHKQWQVDAKTLKNRLLASVSIGNPWLWLGLLVGSGMFSLVLNEVGWWGWYGWLRIIEGGVLAWYVSERLQSSRVLHWYALLLIIGLAGQSALLLLEWGLQRSVGLQWIGEWRFNVYTPGVAKIVFEGQELLRPHATFPHPNVAGGVLSLAIVVVLYWLLRLPFTHSARFYTNNLLSKINFSTLARWCSGMVEVRWVALWLSLVLLLLGLGLAVSFSRSAWVSGLVGIVIALVWQHLRIKKYLHWWRYGVLLMGVAVIGFGPLVWSRLVALDSTDRMSVDRRVQLVEAAHDMIGQQPIWGVGANTFVLELMEYGPLHGVGIWREPVHAVHLLVWSELGTVGLIGWLGVWGVVLWKLGQGFRRTRHPLSGLLLVLWLQIMILGWFDHYWWTSQQGRLVWWGMVGLSVACLQQNKSRVINNE